MRGNGYKCYNRDCKYVVGEICGASANVTLTCIGRIVHKQTNADRIRAMTDEELADFLIGVYIQDYWEHPSDIDDWLKQPYGGADHD